jgi:hypothetical protein
MFMNADSRDLLGRSAYLSDKHFFSRAVDED